MTRITKTPEERRQEMIDTAMKVFYEKGYERTSISDIAREMKVAQGLCYRYFASKEELFDIALDQYAQRQADRICGSLDLGMPLKELIGQMAAFPETEREDGYAQKFCHKPGNWKFHAQLSLKVCSKLRPVVAGILASAVRRGEIRVADTDTAAAFCVYGQLGILLDQGIPAEERAGRIRGFLMELAESWSAC